MINIEALLTELQNNFADIATISLERDEITLILDRSNLIACCQKLRNSQELQFNQLMDLCGVDYLLYGFDEWATDTATSQGFSRGTELHATLETTVKMPARFAVVYHLLSTVYNHRVRLKVFLPGEPPQLPSVINIWQSADWYEREAFDLFGIVFDGHPDLRRILTDYGFIGHPFRKDFPLIGEVEMRYDATQARVIYEPVSIKPRTLVPKVIRQVGHTENG